MMWLIFLPLNFIRCGAWSAATAAIEIFEATKVSQTHNKIEYRLSGHDRDYFSLVFPVHARMRTAHSRMGEIERAKQLFHIIIII